MKRYLFTLSVSLLVVVLPRTIHASAAATSPGGNATEATTDLVSLERFLDLSDAELAQLADAIARVRALTPAQRANLKREIAAFRQLPEPQRQQIRQGWGGMPPEIQAGWRDMMQKVTPEEHAAIQSKLQSLTPEEKHAYRRTLVEAHLKAQAQKK